jgi:hypothetical protein
MDFGPNRKQKKLTAVGISVQDLGNVFFVAASGLWKRDVDETKLSGPTLVMPSSDHGVCPKGLIWPSSHPKPNPR